jgi:hypothetical protein
MSTVMEAPAPRAAAPDRLFYTGMALAFAAIVAVGFAPTFYLRDATLPALSSILVMHGIAFTAWIALLVAQTALIAADRRAWHRALGLFGAALALLMVVLALVAAVEALRQGRAPIPGLDPRTFFAIPMRDIVVFAILITAAIALRKDAQAHKRLILVATICLLAAAIARFPIAAMMKIGPPMFYGLQDLLIVAGMAYDRAFHGRVHRAYWWAGGLMLLSQVLFLAIAGTPPWHAFADALR